MHPTGSGLTLQTNIHLISAPSRKWPYRWNPGMFGGKPGELPGFNETSEGTFPEKSGSGCGGPNQKRFLNIDTKDKVTLLEKFPKGSYREKRSI